MNSRKTDTRTEASYLLERNIRKYVRWGGGGRFYHREELAQRMNIAPSSLSRAITGNPSLRTIEKIAQALDIPIAELFRDDKSLKDKNSVVGFVIINGEIEHITSKEDMLRLGQEK